RFLARVTPPPRCSLFPYTTLFRSHRVGGVGARGEGGPKVMAIPAAQVLDRARHVLAQLGLPDLRCGVRRDPVDLEITAGRDLARSEEHTSELQSRENLVCRLLLEK